MAAVNTATTFVFSGGEVPPHATYVIIHDSITAIPPLTFYKHRYIISLICHANVKRIGEKACAGCQSLQIVIIPGVQVVEDRAFGDCHAVKYLECGNLERVGSNAFYMCISLSSIDLPFAKAVYGGAFSYCLALKHAVFGKDLELVFTGAFIGCTSLERITIPLKNDLILYNDAFLGCKNLRHVDLAEREALSETIATLLLEVWRSDMIAEIDSIDRVLPDTSAGCSDNMFGLVDTEGKAKAIQDWIARILRKITHYTAEHQHTLTKVSAALQLTLPNDIVRDDVLSLLELPPHRFDVDFHDDDDDGTYM